MRKSCSTSPSRAQTRRRWTRPRERSLERDKVSERMRGRDARRRTPGQRPCLERPSRISRARWIRSRETWAANNSPLYQPARTSARHSRETPACGTAAARRGGARPRINAQRITGEPSRAHAADGKAIAPQTPAGDVQRLRDEYQRELQRAQDALRRLNGGNATNGLGGSTPEQQEFSRSAPGTEAFKQDRSGLGHRSARTSTRPSNATRPRYPTRLSRIEIDDRFSAGGSDRVPDAYSRADRPLLRVARQEEHSSHGARVFHEPAALVGRTLLVVVGIAVVAWLAYAGSAVPRPTPRRAHRAALRHACRARGLSDAPGSYSRRRPTGCVRADARRRIAQHEHRRMRTDSAGSIARATFDRRRSAARAGRAVSRRGVEFR